MIALKRQNGHEVFLNADLIETAEREEDPAVTVVVLTTGNTLVVVDEPREIAEKIVAFRKRWAREP
ncbi:MAG: flagellar FlbD family protein [Candidatus Eremiobacteraeota bacterium]|nr:flagellar FlbD family protein [Candidatus Eremiobacteraeota bacterium]MBV9647010.1 flagellar FlbD family protein [Candidatus Eremiobacteraeota bacterium]